MLEPRTGRGPRQPCLNLSVSLRTAGRPSSSNQAVWSSNGPAPAEIQSQNSMPILDGLGWGQAPGPTPPLGLLCGTHGTTAAVRCLGKAKPPESDAYDSPVAIISQLNALPACAPVNASMATLRLIMHDSGSGRLATPFLYDSFIQYSTPVYPGAHLRLLGIACELNLEHDSPKESQEAQIVLPIVEQRADQVDK